MGLISRVSSRTYRNNTMLKINKTLLGPRIRSSRKIVQLKPYTPPEEKPENKLFSENKDLGRTTELNQVARTKFKIEKRTTWPRTFPVRIFNDDGSSYMINYEKPRHIIKFPLEVGPKASGIGKTEDPATFVRKMFLERTGKDEDDFVKLGEALESD